MGPGQLAVAIIYLLLCFGVAKLFAFKGQWFGLGFVISLFLTPLAGAVVAFLMPASAAHQPGGNTPLAASCAGIGKNLLISDAVMWSIAGAGFALAMLLSFLSIRQSGSGDLRTPAVLLVDAAVGFAISLAYRAWYSVDGSAAWPSVWGCVAYGFWFASVFRIIPPIINEDVLYDRHLGSADVPYVLLGLAIHGAAAGLVALPYASRVIGRGTAIQVEENAIQMIAATLAVICLIAAGIRIMVEFH